MDSWEDQVRRFMLDEEEEDDNLFLAIVPSLQLCMYDEKIPAPHLYLGHKRLKKF